MFVREATIADADAMSRVLIASISELCVADHGGRREFIDRWIANKSPESVRKWFQEPGQHFLVALNDGRIVGVAAFNNRGEIILNYVAPEARFQGVSRALLSRVEREMSLAGTVEARLTSTVTAHRFYADAGWADHGPAEARFAVNVQPMRKRLSVAVPAQANGGARDA